MSAPKGKYEDLLAAAGTAFLVWTARCVIAIGVLATAYACLLLGRLIIGIF